MITFTFGEKRIVLEKSIGVGEFVRGEEAFSNVLACKRNNVILNADYMIKDNDSLEPITIKCDEGYLIYKESLILLLLDAAESLADCAAVFVRQSVNKSTYFEVRCKSDEKNAVAERLKRRMKEITDENRPFKTLEITREAASELYKMRGEEKKTRDILSLASKKIKLCKTAKEYHIIYQPPAYSPRALSNFDIQIYGDGFLLKYPTNYTVDKIPMIKSGEKVHRAIEDYRDWITTVGAGDIFGLNGYISTGRGTELVNLSEGLHEKRISKIADKIKENSDIKIILIAGPSASGKTTFANRLCLHLRINHINPVVISLDDYYVNDDKMPRDENGEMDLECVDAIDYKLFNRHLALLAKGESVVVPKYDFNKRSCVKGTPITLKENQIIIAEGIHALNELLTSEVEKKNKYKIYLSALTSLCLDEYNAFSPTDNRLLRRMVRDASYRNTSPERTFKLWENVRKGEQEYIFPFESEADEVFNSSLLYEMAVLKKPALELLEKIDKKSRYYSRALRLCELLAFFCEMSPEAIPPTSIIREFIGGSTIVH